MEGELGVLQVERKIRGRVKRQMEKTQREYYLNEQLKAIQNELGGSDGEEANELAELQERIVKTKLSKEAREKATNELKKLKSMQPMSAEATVIRNYLDVLLGLPWGQKSKLKRDISQAQLVLDADHYALDKVKDRIIEYLAVQARTNKLKGPILCLVGPPGVGKTSLGKSIAKATGREFVRQSLGGVRDEAEIRGHRRTYIGSLPGKICARRVNPTRCFCSTRSTSWARISAVIRHRRCSKCWTRNRTPSSRTTISNWISTCRTSCLSARRTASTCRRRCSTAWKSSVLRGIPRTRR